ncbi:MAG: hypothetical protein QHH05_02175 [Syntrophomonadaceae bacterium]|nr:hypothetical protein [Syntrophomonadaceae bacterium]
MREQGARAGGHGGNTKAVRALLVAGNGLRRCCGRGRVKAMKGRAALQEETFRRTRWVVYCGGEASAQGHPR